MMSALASLLRFLVVAAGCVLVNTAAEDDVIVVPAFQHLPRGRRALQVASFALPWRRFKPYSTLSTDDVTSAATLDYKKSTWNALMSNGIEESSYYSIINQTLNALAVVQQKAIHALDISPAEWECWINHYIDYDWPDLVMYGIDTFWEGLGWNESTWNGTIFFVPESESQYWVDLSPTEQSSAEELCYSELSWNGELLPDWPPVEETTRSPGETMFPTVLEVAPPMATPHHCRSGSLFAGCK